LLSNHFAARLLFLSEAVALREIAIHSSEYIFAIKRECAILACY